MKYLKTIGKVLAAVAEPLRLNCAFAVFMYMLGCITAWATLPDARGAHLYDNLYLELFLDAYVLTLILTVLPRKVMIWVRGFFYFALYATAVVDVYCFVKFQSTLTPTMLQLVGETDSRESGEFLRSCVSPDVLLSNVGWVLLLMFVHIISALQLRFPHFIPRRWRELIKSIWLRTCELLRRARPVIGTAVLALLVWSVCASAHNKAATHKLMSGTTIGEVEHTLTEKDHAVLYQPIYRLVFSIYANTLTAKQIDRLVRTASKVQVDSCSFRSPNIVLIIGESYGRHHSQQYGYFMKTTPRQAALEKSRKLTKFTDVVTCWNLTSFVFKNVFSTHVVGEKGDWCDYPLFPELFRKAGYQVTFITNEFLPQAKEAVYDFSGGFFLNNPELSKLQFDNRNTELHPLDDGLLDDYDNHLKQKQGEHNLIIFHLMGQHVDYKSRYRKEQTEFWAGNYEDKRPELNAKQRKMLSHYDNATLYNDSIVAQIVKRFEKEDAIIIYMPDHGEECYEENRGFICRNHSAAIDWPLAHYEFEIPFWIYCSRKYIRKHRDIYKQIRKAKDLRYMTDALPHLLLYLAGIETPTYQAKYNILSPEYDEMRPRILKNSADYDKLRDEHIAKEKKANEKKKGK